VAAQDERRNPLVWFAAAGGIVMAATLVAIAFWVLRFGEPSTEAPSRASTGTPALSPLATPALVRDTPLRVAPAADAREVATALKGTPLRLAGRLEDGSWYAVEVVGRLDALGWVPAAALTAVEASLVPVVSAPGSGSFVPQGAGLNDLPNLVLDRLIVRQNRLIAVLSNDGHIDLPGPFTVTVGNGEAHQITLPGKSLRPGDRIENPVEGEYVQRRASVVVIVTTTTREETTDDNRLDAIVEPDVPNDLEVLTAAVAPELSVTVRNNSPIPLVGTINITARETAPSSRLLRRLDDAPLRIDAGGTQAFVFTGLTGLDLSRTQVLIDTTAINDADVRNDVYPR
jgi:hypothetical protein